MCRRNQCIAVVSPQHYLWTVGGSLTWASTAVDIILSACQPWTMTICPNTTSPLNTLHHHKQVCWDVCDNESGLGMGVADTFSMMTSFSGINGVAQQLCVEPLIQLAATLISLAFPRLRCRGSVSYQAMPCIPLTHPLYKHSNDMLAFMVNGSYTFSAGYQRSADV